MRKIPVAMTIAGSDSGGGAGIEADLKTFSALGVHGTVAITSITAQNTYSVIDVYDLPGRIVYNQIKAVYEDMGIDAAKTGMLSNSEIISAVAQAIRDFSIKNLVVDPVMIAKSGARLLREDAVEALKSKLLPLALVATPNASEAEVLAGFSVKTLDDAKKAAKTIHEKYGTAAVIVKGGHLKELKAVDVVYYNGEYYLIESERILDGCFHGTGCSFSAAITAFLAKSFPLLNAIQEAKKFIDMAIRFGLKIGKGHCPVNPIAYIEIPAAKFHAIENVRKAVEILLENQSLVLPYVPEVGINVVEAIEARYVTGVNDVAGVEGRIVKAGNRLAKVGEVKMGGSSHLARLVIALMRSGHEIYAAVNIRFDKAVVEKAIEKGFKVAFVDRRREPAEIKEAPMGSMEWIASQITKEIPDLIYDVGDVGKEPMIRVLGKNAVDAVKKLLQILA